MDNPGGDGQYFARHNSDIVRPDSAMSRISRDQLLLGRRF
jgi:hypothetical protein